MSDLDFNIEFEELKERARALGVKRINELNEEQLNERISVLLRVKAEGLTRLEFDEERNLMPTLNNLRILQIEAVQKKHTLTRFDVLEKLKGYSLIANKFNTTNNRWTRYIDTEDGFLRGGGFPIRNKPEEPFLVLKNVSQKFTFSIQRETVILFEKIPKNSPLLNNPTINDLVSEFRDKSGSLYVTMDDNFAVEASLSMAQLARTLKVNRGSLARKFRGEVEKHKQYYLFRLTPGDRDMLIHRVANLTDAEREGNSCIRPSVLDVINHYYPFQ